MYYIDEFNKMTGTRYTKESFIKLFTQYFPEGIQSDKSYGANYKTMFEHALRFSVRSYVFGDDKNVDISKVASGLNTLFDEQISDYNKLMTVKGQENKNIRFVNNGGFDAKEIKNKLFECISDIPKTLQDEEEKVIKNALIAEKNIADNDVFRKVVFGRLDAINGQDSSYSKEEKYERSLDVIRVMQSRLDSHDKNYKVSHPVKYNDEKHAISDAKDYIENLGYSKNNIEKDLLAPAKETPQYERLSKNIMHGSERTLDEENADLRRLLAESTTNKGVAIKANQISGTTKQIEFTNPQK